jgi:hypothetical protein
MKKTTFIILSVLFLFSCKKHEANCATTTESVSGSYKVTTATYRTSANAAEMDYIPVLFPNTCERDDVITFIANGTYQFADVGIVCTPAGDSNGTWSLTGINSMTIDGDAVILERFDCKKLIFVNTDTQVSGDLLKLTLTRQ